MKAKCLVFFAMLGCILALSIPSFAHHGNSSLDTGKKETIKGTVTQWLWANPHCWLKVDVKDDSGNVVNWVVETNNAADMMEKGWSKQSFQVGEEVTVTLEPVKNGKPAGRILEVTKQNGQVLGLGYLKH